MSDLSKHFHLSKTSWLMYTLCEVYIKWQNCISHFDSHLILSIISNLTHGCLPWKVIVLRMRVPLRPGSEAHGVRVLSSGNILLVVLLLFSVESCPNPLPFVFLFTRWRLEFCLTSDNMVLAIVMWAENNHQKNPPYNVFPSRPLQPHP